MGDAVEKVAESVSAYYSGKIREHGPTSAGVDWNGEEGQFLRFQQLSRIFSGEGGFSVNDVGCGFGAMYDWIRRRWQEVDYLGCDLSEEMIAAAGERFTDGAFVVGETTGRTADYSVASGIFNVKLHNEVDEWEDFIFECIESLDKHSSKGFAFNCLTSYSDPEYLRDDLYYADPVRFFDHCKRNYSRNVALLHDYDLYEFTIIIRK